MVLCYGLHAAGARPGTVLPPLPDVAKCTSTYPRCALNTVVQHYASLPWPPARLDQPAEPFVLPALFPFCCADCVQAAECELLNEQHEQLQGISLEADQLREQVQQLRQATADLPALREELQELQNLLTVRQQLQQEAQDAEQLRQQVQQLREAKVDLAALREELQQLQSAHDEAIAHVRELKEKVCMWAALSTCLLVACAPGGLLCLRMPFLL